MPTHLVHDPCFVLPETNPFSPDGHYDANWVSLRLVDTDEFQMMTRTDRVFGLTLSKRCEGWQYRLVDFLNYQLEYRRNIIVVCDRHDLCEATRVYGASSIRDRALRYYEPAFLVHSTASEAYRSICSDGYISSWNGLKARGAIQEPEPIGTLLGDPADLSDFVMLGSGVACEIVVSSRQKGAICMDAACGYWPGARLYVDMTAVARDGLLVRDGAHYKVRDRLPLSYVVFCATLSNVDMRGMRVTPRSFADGADEAFAQSLKTCGTVQSSDCEVSGEP